MKLQLHLNHKNIHTCEVICRPGAQFTGSAGVLVEHKLVLFTGSARPAAAHLTFTDHLDVTEDCVSINLCVEASSELVNYLSFVIILCKFLRNQKCCLHGSTYLDLSFITRLTADGFDDCIFVGPDFIIINLQSAVVPTANNNVVIVVLPHFFEVHYLVPVDKRQTYIEKIRHTYVYV